MFNFWYSTEKLTDQGLKLAWFGIFVTAVGLAMPQVRWISCVGLLGTVLGLVLRHRGEHLKKLQATFISFCLIPSFNALTIPPNFEHLTK